MSKLQWQGENIKKWFGYCKVKECYEKPLMWYNYEVHLSGNIELIPAIKIEYQGELFCISNHFGIGYYKLSTGGWPNCKHFTLPVNTFEENHDLAFNIHQFDLNNFSQWESGREKWQKENFPVEYERIMTLRNQIKRQP